MRIFKQAGLQYIAVFAEDGERLTSLTRANRHSAYGSLLPRNTSVLWGSRKEMEEVDKRPQGGDDEDAEKER